MLNLEHIFVWCWNLDTSACTKEIFLISSFRRVLYFVRFLLGNYPASGFYMPMKMEQTECSETSAYKIQTPGNYAKESIQNTKKYSRSFEMWCWRKMEISLTDRVKNEEVNEIREVRNLLYTKKEGKLTGLVTSCVGTAF